MYKKRTSRPRRRAPRRRARKAYVPRALTLKPYNYVFTLKSQVLVPNQVAGQPFGIGSATGTGAFPIVNSDINAITSTNGFSKYLDVLIGTSFRLNDVASVATFAGMYDAYCIKKVTCEIEFLSNIAGVNTSALMPTLYHYWDQDDATPPTTVAAVVGKQGVVRKQFGNKSRTSIKFTCKPTPVTDSTALPSLINVNKTQWIDCLDTNIQHNAVKMMITDVYYPAVGSLSNTAFRFNWKYHVAFRGPVTTL